MRQKHVSVLSHLEWLLWFLVVYKIAVVVDLQLPPKCVIHALLCVPSRNGLVALETCIGHNHSTHDTFRIYSNLVFKPISVCVSP
jgi:hypothetical protein